MKYDLHTDFLLWILKGFQWLTGSDVVGIIGRYRIDESYDDGSVKARRIVTLVGEDPLLRAEAACYSGIIAWDDSMDAALGVMRGYWDSEYSRGYVDGLVKMFEVMDKPIPEP